MEYKNNIILEVKKKKCILLRLKVIIIYNFK